MILTAVLLVLKLGGAPLHSEVITSSAVESLIDSALAINLVILILSLIPIHYFHGEIKGMETDGLQIIQAIRNRGSQSQDIQEQKHDRNS